MSDTKVYEPSIRALLGTAALFCEVDLGGGIVARVAEVEAQLPVLPPPGERETAGYESLEVRDRQQVSSPWRERDNRLRALVEVARVAEVEPQLPVLPPPVRCVRVQARWGLGRDPQT